MTFADAKSEDSLTMAVRGAGIELTWTSPVTVAARKLVTLDVPLNTHQHTYPFLPVQLGVGGLLHLPHPTLADEGGDVVVAESGAA